MDPKDDGFILEPRTSQKPYLGDQEVVQGLLSAFANDVMAEYHKFLAAEPGGMDAQANISAMAKRYGDIFMGRSPNYEAAPWQSVARMGGKLRYAVDSIKGEDDPGEGYFRFIAAQCLQASQGLAKGMEDEDVGFRLEIVLEEAAKRLLGVI